jgi:type IV secretory pathway VirB6-like protein
VCVPESCSNCGRPLRPWLRGFCARCVTTPSQRARLAQSAGAISKEGPLGRAMDLVGIAVLIAAAIALVVVLTAWLGVTAGLIALVVVVILGALGLLGVAG